MYRKDTHVSAIDRTSYALSYQGRRGGGKMEFGMNGVSLAHSDSVNASASVPSSQLFGISTSHENVRMQRGRHFRRKFGIPLCGCVDGIVSDEAQNRPVQSEICAGPWHGSGGDES
jgi:hypothetical protein